MRDRSNEDKARHSKVLHITLAIFWCLMVPVTLLTSLKTSLPFIVFLSIYALVATHLSAAAGKSAKQEAAESD